MHDQNPIKHPIKHRRSIRSFTIRGGRLTRGQQKAHDRLFLRYRLQLGEFVETPLSVIDIFGQSGALNIEIGFGDGELLKQLAVAKPQQNFVGIEVHPPGVGHLLLKLEECEIANVRIFKDDAMDVITKVIADQSVDRFLLFFPDPWHKKKHHKRRMVQPDFVNLIAEKLKPEGVFHFATDWQPYAEQGLQVLENCASLQNAAGAGNFTPRPDYRPQTKFERRGLALGHSVYDIIMSKI